MKELHLIGRLLLGGYFLFSGAHHFMDAAAMTHFAAQKGVPYPAPAILLAGVLLLIGGLSLVLGVAPKIGIAALVLFLVPVTVLMHPFWRESGATRMMDMVNFTKNVALLGSILMFTAIPRPWPLSVEGRRTFFARHAKI